MYAYVRTRVSMNKQLKEKEITMVSNLIEKIREKQAPIVAGLDPTPEMIPPQLLEVSRKEFGNTPEALADSFLRFNKEIIDHIADLVPAVKPQIAMYERLGITGLEAYRETITYAKEKGLIVVGDVKRGDIGSTSAAYADAHIGKVSIEGEDFYPFDEDFATVNPYLGSDGVEPFVKICREEDRGIFVLVKTSNPSSGEFQDRLVVTKEGNRPLYEIVAEKVNEWGSTCMDGSYSNVGAVVGATYPEQGKILRKLMPKAFILVPGYGAQGGKGADLVHFFNEDKTGALVNSSRGIIAAWKQETYAKFGAGNFGEASREAVRAMRKDIATALGL